MIQGSNMTVAIRQLSAKIQAARAYAVTNRCNVAVLLLETGVKDEYCYSAYRVCVVDSSNVFQEWIEDENWKNLPKGVLRASISQKATVTSIPAADTAAIGGSSLTSASALVFQKDGRMTHDTSEISLRQGRYVNESSVYTERNGNGQFISHPIEINRYSGKVTVKPTTETDS